MASEAEEVERRIAAPVDAVWRLLTDLEGAWRERGGLEAVQRLTPGPFGVGTRWRETRRVNGRVVNAYLAVTSYGPGPRCVVESGAGSGSYTLEYALLSYVFDGEPEAVEPSGANEGSVVRVSIRTAPPGRLGRLLTMVRAPGVAVMARQAVLRDLACAAATLEAGREPAA